MVERSSPQDITIAGAGYVGLATAVALKSSAPHLAVTVIDAAPAGVWRNDTRASAIAAAASRMLDRLGCWEAILPEAQPITEMIVTDSRTSDPVRPVFLTFNGEVEPGEPFAHMVENRVLNASLRKKAEELGVTFIEGAPVNGFEHGEAHLTVRYSDKKSLRTRLLIAADGVKSRLREMAGIKVVNWEYGQSGIVCTVAHERPHHGRAEEHFLPAGPFAVLPLKGNRSSLVWTERTADAERLINEDDFVFEAELEQRFGLKLGEVHVEGSRKAFPLGLALARDFVKPRFALVGDAAHGIHPIAGQGLNLGFKDAAALAETIVDADRFGRGARTLPDLAPLRHGADGRHHGRFEPAVFQRQRTCQGAARFWSRPCRTDAAAQGIFHPPGRGIVDDGAETAAGPADLDLP
jgi:2-octaprenyl-6-methoxyphenol hydroxylase